MATDNRTTTLFVIAYDIVNDRRRTKVHKLLSSFGHWTQYSLFECYLTEKSYVQLRQRSDRVLAAGQDSVRFYPLCQACRKRVETIGSERPQEPEMFLV